MVNWNAKLPNVDAWQPSNAKEETLSNALMITCQVSQARIVARTNSEVAFNLQNFDSGLAVEEIIREELESILPDRYAVSPGIISDRQGRTAGDCDLVVRDPLWSPVIKPGATQHSRRFHFPIEGVYSVAEIKQSLGVNELDKAMEKLVKLARLERPNNPYGHITENQHLPWLDKEWAVLNPLHTTVFATRLADDADFDDVAIRFGKINAMLNRRDMVKMLCVLGEGTAWYSVESGNPYNSTYMADREEPLVMQINANEPENAFYRYYVELLGHLTRSVLNFAGIENAYGLPPPPREVRQYPQAVFNADLS